MTSRIFLHITLLFLLVSPSVYSQSKLLIYMDMNQTDHLKAYGITFNALNKGIKADWLLNYRGGSFLLQEDPAIVREA